MQEAVSPSDEQLAEMTQNGQVNAYAELMKRYQSKLIRYAGFFLRDEDAAADAVQETFIRAYSNIKGFDTEKKFSSWIYRITRNESLRYIEKHKRELPFPEDFDKGYDAGVEDTVDDEYLKSHVQELVNQLSRKYAEVIRLFYLEEKSYREISEILLIPEGTVAVRLNRAKQQLKQLCQTNQKNQIL